MGFIHSDPFLEVSENILIAKPIEMTEDEQLAISGEFGKRLVKKIWKIFSNDKNSNTGTGTGRPIHAAIQFMSSIPCILCMSDLKFVDKQFIYYKKYVKDKVLPINACCAVMNDQLVMIITIYRVEDETLSPRIVLEKYFQMEGKGTEFVLIYLHELFHLVQRHLEKTHVFFNYIYKKMKEMKLKFKDEKKEYMEFLNIALDAHINSTISRINYEYFNLFKKMGSIITNDIDSKEMSEIDSIDYYLKKMQNNKMKMMSDSGVNIVEIDGEQYVVTSNGIETGKKDKSDALSKGIKDIIDTAMNRLRGTAAAQILEGLGIPLKTDTDWFEKLKTHCNNAIYKITEDCMITWSKPNYMKKHLIKSPGMRYLDNKPLIVMAFDQSGSMDNEILRKFNYYVKKLIDDLYNVVVIIHDVEIANIFDSEDCPDIVEEMSSRRACGGTSHKYVFDQIEEWYENEETSNMFVLICSDMYSDIEQIYKNYSWITDGKIPIIGASNGESLPIPNTECHFVKD